MVSSLSLAVYLVVVLAVTTSYLSVDAFQVSTLPTLSTNARHAPHRIFGPSLESSTEYCQSTKSQSTVLRASQASDDDASFWTTLGRQVRRPFSKTKKLFKSLVGRSQDEISSTLESMKADAASKVETLTNEAATKVENLTNEAAFKMESITNEAVAKIESVKEQTEVADKKAKEAASELSNAVKTIFNEQKAIAAKNVDFSGTWSIVVTEEFKKIYDHYLMLLGQPSLVRSVAMSIVGFTTEEMVQSDQGKELFIRGRNMRGVWERTIVASDKEDRTTTSVVTADGENVQAEAWWEQGGTIHISWMRGVQKYGGGDFESKRYLADDGKTLVCDSIFHPVDKSRDKVTIQWKFSRA